MPEKEKRIPNKQPSGSMQPFMLTVLLIVAVLYGAHYSNRLNRPTAPSSVFSLTPIEWMHPEFAVTRISPVVRRHTRKTVNLRQGPNTSYERVGSVPANSILEIIGVSGDWYLTHMNGREVFIAGWLTYDLPTATPVVRRDANPRINVQRFTSPQRKYTHGVLNIRIGPGISYRRVGQIGAGDAVIALGRSGDWYLIKHNGRDAYVASWLTHNSPPAAARAAQPAQHQPAQQQLAPQPQSYTCDCRKTCPEMSSCQEAYFQLNNCGCQRRDGDNDGVPCESICR